MGVRDDQKAATREKVLVAARDLFNEVGYEETTIRAIAERAGVSVGSVFTTFALRTGVATWAPRREPPLLLTRVFVASTAPALRTEPVAGFALLPFVLPALTEGNRLDR